MSTIAVKNEKVFVKNQKKESLFKQILNAYREYQAEIVCGALALYGNANAFELYRMLKK